MPDRQTLRRARKDAREGKAPSTQAGEFVREEIEHVREGKHGAKSAKQAIAIGLSKARRAGIKLPPPATRNSSPQTRRKAKLDSQASSKLQKPAPKRAHASTATLKKESRTALSSAKISIHGRQAAADRTSNDRSVAAKKAAKTRAERR
ncbi:MAG TPA: DUF6496 domain-containing protein [Candidatus Binataceae bacterium]|nr:DUF6496 domain-containing protein [Candidatus Binataceae bacterium]